MGNLLLCDKKGKEDKDVRISVCETARESKILPNKPNNLVLTTEPISLESKIASKMNERLNQRIDYYYNMNHTKRGIALIFNHESFDDIDWAERIGTQADCQNLRKTFIALNFEVRIHNDRTKSEMKNILQKVSAEDHSENDCLVVIILTHGEVIPSYNKTLNEENSTILSHDIVSHIRTKDKKFALQKVFRYFTDEYCPSLVNKPRLFFVQACQGTELDEGFELKSMDFIETAMDTSPFKSKQPILPHKDFLVAYASLPGFVSFRNNAEGSWFIRALCIELEKFKYEYDLLQILTITCQTVAFEFESHADVKLKPELDKKKQMPCIQSMLTKLLVFEEKKIATKPQETQL